MTTDDGTRPIGYATSGVLVRPGRAQCALPRALGCTIKAGEQFADMARIQA